MSDRLSLMYETPIPWVKVHCDCWDEMIFFDCNRFIETSMRQRRGWDEGKRESEQAGLSRLLHALAEASAERRLYVYIRKPSSVVDRPESHLSKAKVGMPMDTYGLTAEKRYAQAHLQRRGTF